MEELVAPLDEDASVCRARDALHNLTSGYRGFRVFPNHRKLFAIPAQKSASNSRNPHVTAREGEKGARRTMGEQCVGFVAKTGKPDSIKPDHAFRCRNPKVSIRAFRHSADAVTWQTIFRLP